MDMRTPSSPANPATQAVALAVVQGHMGELVQGRLNDALALVTLPYHKVRVRARLADRPSDLPLVARMVARLGQPDAAVEIMANVPAGCGAGVSTASALATLRLLAPNLSPEAENAHLLAVEGAVDPLAYATNPPRIWASRRAKTLAILPTFPALVAVGGFDGPGQQTDPTDLNFPDMAAAFELLHRPTPENIGRAASLSALANQQRNPRPNWAAAQALAAETGALGIAVAHTGAALSLLYMPGTPGISRAQAGLAALGLTHVMRFAFGGSTPMLGDDEH